MICQHAMITSLLVNLGSLSLPWRNWSVLVYPVLTLCWQSTHLFLYKATRKPQPIRQLSLTVYKLIRSADQSSISRPQNIRNISSSWSSVQYAFYLWSPQSTNCHKVPASPLSMLAILLKISNSPGSNPGYPTHPYVFWDIQRKLQWNNKLLLLYS